jgi:hypothetical protein
LTSGKRTATVEKAQENNMAKKKRKQGARMTPALKKRVWDAVRTRYPAETIKAIAESAGVSIPTIQRIVTALKKERGERVAPVSKKALTRRPDWQSKMLSVGPIRVMIIDETANTTHYADRVMVDSSGTDLPTLARRLEEMARVLRSTRESISGGDVIVTIRTKGRR